LIAPIVVYSAMIKPELRRPPSQAIPIRSHDSATTKFRTLIHSQSESEVVCMSVAGEAPFISHLPTSPSFLPSPTHLLLPSSPSTVHNLLPSSHLLLLSCHLLPPTFFFLLPTSLFSLSLHSPTFTFLHPIFFHFHPTFPSLLPIFCLVPPTSFLPPFPAFLPSSYTLLFITYLHLPFFTLFKI